MNTSKISIIVPVYNVEKYLPQCLDSLLNQTMREIEILCVNDESSDDSLSILNDYRSKDDRITIISQKNTGVSGARNKGLKYVKAEYVMFIDSDDWIDLDTCEIAYKKAIEENVDVVMWTYVRETKYKSKPKIVFKEDKIIFDKIATKVKLHRRLVGLYKEDLLHPENLDSLVTAWGKLYKTEIIKINNIEFVDTEKIGTEDLLFNIQVFGFVESAIFLNRCLNHYRKYNSSSLTATSKKKLFERWMILFNIIEDYINDNSYDDFYLEALNNRIVLSIVGLGLNELYNNNIGHIERLKNIRIILINERYRLASRQIELKFFPIHWKIFYAFVKLKFTIGIYIFLLVIKKIKRR